MNPDEALRELLPIRDLIAAATTALDPQDQAARIAWCRQTGQHGVRVHVTDADDLLDFWWGGRRLAMVRRADLFSGEPLAASFVPDCVPDAVPPEWGQQ